MGENEQLKQLKVADYFKLWMIEYKQWRIVKWWPMKDKCNL